MKKRLCSGLLTLVVILTLLPPSVAVAAGEMDSGWPFQKEARFNYDYAERYGGSMVRVCVGVPKAGGKWGVINATGKEIAPPIYDDVRYLSDSLVAVCVGAPNSGGKWGVIDATGKEIAPQIYDDVRYLSDGLVKVCVGDPNSGGKWGIIDATGKEIAPQIYDDVWSVSDSLLEVCVGGLNSGGKWGLIDHAGREVAAPQYDSIQSSYDFFSNHDPFSSPLAAERDGKYGFLDAKDGSVVVPFKYDAVDAFSEGLARVTIFPNNWYGVIDTKGNEIVPPTKYTFIGRFEYNSVKAMSKNYAVVSIPDGQGGLGFKYGIIDRTGREVIPCKYDDVNQIDDQIKVAKVALDRKFGFVDLTTGEELVPPKYARTSWNFSFGTMSVEVEMNAGEGLVDKRGEIIPPRYDKVSILSNDFAEVELDYKRGLVALATGEEIVPPGQYQFWGLSGGVAALQVEGGFRFVDTAGQEVPPPEYLRGDITETLLDNVAYVRTGWVNPGKQYVEEKGEIITALSNQICAGCAGDYEKAKAIFGWVTQNIEYDYDYYLLRKSYVTTDPEGVLATKHTICDGYSKLTLALLYAQGIPAAYVRGYVRRDGWEPHAWNMVFVDGRWITVDSTWGWFDPPLEEFSQSHVANFASFKTEVKDVPASWAQDEVWSAICSSLVPNDLQADYGENITREDFCRLMVRLAEKASGQTISEYLASKGLTASNHFTDTDDPAVNAAFALGIVNGTSDTTFNPLGSIDRQSAAAMLSRTAKLFGIEGGNGEAFLDEDQIADWAKESISFVSGITDPTTGRKAMGGTGEGNFSPLETYTREQAILTALRLFHCKG